MLHEDGDRGPNKVVSLVLHLRGVTVFLGTWLHMRDFFFGQQQAESADTRGHLQLVLCSQLNTRSCATSVKSSIITVVLKP